MFSDLIGVDRLNSAQMGMSPGSNGTNRSLGSAVSKFEGFFGSVDSGR